MQRFNDHPLHEDIVNYCVADAAYLPRLFEKYNNYAALKRSVDLRTRVCVWPKIGYGCYQYNRYGVDWADRIVTTSWERVQKATDANFPGGTAHNPWYEDDDDDDYYYNW